MISTNEINELRNATVVGANNESIGTVGSVLVDTATGQPEWVSVNSGAGESLVPISDASFSGGVISVPFSAQQISDAPNFAVDQDLSEADEARLYAHYGVAYSEAPSPSGLPAEGFSGQAQNTRGANDDAMTLSEEQVHVGTEKVQTGRARLRKWVETEEVNVPVTVTKEKVRLEREPITDGNIDQALDGPDISEAEHEVTLTEERVVVAKETVPVERVRLAKDVETVQETVSETVRKEHIDTEGVDDVYPTDTTTTQAERNLR